MKKIILPLVILALVIVGAYLGISYYFSNQLLFPSLLTDEELKAEYGPIIPAEVGLEVESVTFPCSTLPFPGGGSRSPAQIAP